MHQTSMQILVEEPMTRTLCVATTCLILNLFSPANLVSGAETAVPAAVLTQYVNDDTFAVASLNIAAMGPSKDHEAILTPQLLMALKYMPADAQAQIFLVSAADTLARRFHDVGGEAIYVIAGLA